MRTVTASSLITALRDRVEVRDPYFTDARLLELFNLAILDLQDAILEVNRTFNVKSATINLVSGIEAYTLPTDLYRLFGVRVKDTDGYYRRIGPFDWEENLEADDEPASRTDMQYHLGGLQADGVDAGAPTGAQIYLRPAPNWTLIAGLKVWYVPVLANLTTTPANQIDLVAGWEEYLYLWTEIRCRMKQEEDAQPAMQLLAEQRGRIQRAVKVRDVASAPVVRDCTVDREYDEEPWKRLPRT